MVKKSFRFYLALYTGKFIRRVERILKKNASYFPGKIAIKICPDFLDRIEKPETIISVTGTNGKTTVCNMLIDAFEKNGRTVLSNKAGSNTNGGLASALIAGTTFTGRNKRDMAVFEVDERSSKLIYPYIKPNFSVCTNLFRDSIHRNANPEFIFNVINSSLPETTHLILNGDDLISCNLGEKNKKTYFSIDRLPSDRDECINLINDVRICPKCHKPLKYEYVRYHHIGKAKCEFCGYASPESDFTALPDLENNTLTVKHDNTEETYDLISNSIFNIYNELTVITVLREMGMSAEKVKETLDSINIIETRYIKENVKGMEFISHMTKGKNPVACSCVFDYVGHEPGSKEVILFLDNRFDMIDSSENITWIYDTDFEFLNQPNITNIVVAGVRTNDYMLRLLMAGIPEEKIKLTNDTLEAYKLLNLKGTDTVYLLYDMWINDYAMQLRENIKQYLNEVL